ncbi:MAG: SMC-Scp complex subunit ScpB [Myxococcales bacterium]|nr:SMC-Scp complex subunit ScpB [Myxococcales bacterium]
MKRSRSPRSSAVASPPSGEAELVRESADEAGLRDGAAADDVAEHVSLPWVDALTGDEPLSASDDGEPAASELPELSWPLSGERLTSVLESLLFASDKPLSVERIHELLEETAAAPHKPSGPPLYKPQQLQAALVALATLLEEGGRGIGLHEVAGGWQLRTAPSNAPWVQRMLKQKPVRLSRAQLEALAIVAYRQPITRPEIDDIRGVDSGASLRMLLDRGLIRILGKKEEPGRPLLYGTTREFLEFFNLKDLKDLPTLREYYDLTDESRDKVRAAGFEPPATGPAQGSLPVDPVLEPPTTAAVEESATAAAAEAPASAPPAARPVELIDQQLADDAENLAKIDEMIRAVNTAFPLLDPQLFGGPAVVPSPNVPTPTAAESAEPSDEPADGPVERDEQS